MENVVLAAYHGRDDWQDHQVKDVHGGMFYPTRVASPQGTLIPFTPQESLVVYRHQSPRRRALGSRPCDSCHSSRECPPDKVGFSAHRGKGCRDAGCLVDLAFSQGSGSGAGRVAASRS